LPPESGSSIFSIDLLRNPQRALAVYFDNAGGKPPRALIWDLATNESAPVKFDAMPTCGGVVKDKLWLCTSEGKTLTITKLE